MLVKTLLYSAYWIATQHVGPDGSEKVVYGTCFHVSSNGRTFIVTNKHNVELSYKDAKYVGYKWRGMQIGGYCNTDDYFEISFDGHTIRFGTPHNPAEDVFVFEAPKTPMHFRRRKKPGEPPDQQTTTFNPIAADLAMLANDDDLRRLSAGTQVVFPSYSAHYDRSSGRPVMRTGIISSDPESDYLTDGQEPARRILFQAQSSDGASGSPVYALMEGQGVLLGINAGHLIGTEPRLGPIHSGFSYCFKAVCIREAIDRIVNNPANPPAAEGGERPSPGI